MFFCLCFLKLGSVSFHVHVILMCIFFIVMSLVVRTDAVNSLKRTCTQNDPPCASLNVKLCIFKNHVVGWEGMKIGQLILMKIIKIVATRCRILRLKCTKIDIIWGSAPDPAGELTVLPHTPLLKGAYC